ncbi:hypothetical protein FIBSPDRAFT_730548, partial [Athelia psychrophila]
MLRQCVSPDQRDWVGKLRLIKFTMNSASSATTGYAPFVLNTGRMPPSMGWNADSEFPGVHVFAQRIKDVIIIAARVKQTQMANRKRENSPFATGDLVSL